MMRADEFENIIAKAVPTNVVRVANAYESKPQCSTAIVKATIAQLSH
jgi:hypothetical protein